MYKFLRIKSEDSVVALSYVVINYGTFFLGIVTYLLYLKALNPLEIGLIAISRTWGQLFDYLHLGTRFSIDRYSPIRQGSFPSSLLLLAMTSSILIGFNVIALLYFLKHEELVFYSIIVSSLILAVSNCFKAHFRAIGKVKDLLVNALFLQFLPSAINLIIFWIKPDIETLKFYCIPYFGFAFLLIVYYRNILLIKRPVFRMISAGKNVYKHASSQFLYAAISFLNITADRFYVEYRLGRESLGIYSIQLFVFSALSFLPATLSELKIREIMKNYSTKPCLPSSQIILFVGAPTVLGLMLTFLVIHIASSFYPIVGAEPLGFYISAVCVLPMIFSSLYSHTISASRNPQLLVMLGGGIFILNLFLLFAHKEFIDDFTVAGPLIKLFVAAIESIILYKIAKSIIANS